MDLFFKILARYLEIFPDEREKGRLDQFHTLLKNTSSVDSLVSRKRFEGHVTASGILIWRTKQKVLVMRHNDLPDHYHYYQPGGHFSASNESPLELAKRKVQSGLGASSFTYFPIDIDLSIPLDIDTHFIPKLDSLGESQHYHHDFRYLFFLDELRPIEQLPTGSRWDDLNELGRQHSFSQLIPKVRKILAEDGPRAFFDAVTHQVEECPKVSCIAVAHIIPDIPPYLSALRRCFNLTAVIPKPKSINPLIEKRLKGLYNICALNREQIASGSQLLDIISTIQGDFVLLDIGGYFSTAVHRIFQLTGRRFLGVVEDTENGHQKYLKEGKKSGIPVPVISVARSPLKDNEDFLVGQSVVFSADYILRSVGSLIQYHQCAVIGYGKIGSSIAHHLLLRGVKPWVFDSNPIRRARAVNQLCNTPLRPYLIKHADIIFCATGSHALDIHDFRLLKSGCFIMSVTSSDDEMDLAFLAGEYTPETITSHVVKYSSFTNYFYLVNDGNAVNFIHDAVLGDSIHLVRGEIISAAKSLLSKQISPGITELSVDERKKVVQCWLEAFVDTHSVTSGD